MAFLIDGILASEHLDSSGEILSIEGCDISSIHRGEGVVNFEHESKNPNQLLGRIIQAKKIFGPEDAENDRMAYYWEKCKCPFIYILCELFDSDVCKHIAAMFEYSAKNKTPNSVNVLGFSIEGSKLTKEGPVVKTCVGRKATLTVAACNKSCIAEMVPQETKSSPEDSIFKSESSYTIELFDKSEELKKAEPMKKAMPWSAGKQKGDAVHFSHPEHGTVSIHKDPAGSFNVKHNGALAGLKGVKGSFPTAEGAGSHAKAYMGAVSNGTVQAPKMHDRSSPQMLGKAMTAGSGMAGPGTLSGGTALGKESLDKKMKKGELLQRAEQEYQTWSKREEFENFMAKTMPSLTKSEIQVIGQTLCLKKSLKAEKALKKMMRDEGQDSWVDKKEK